MPEFLGEAQELLEYTLSMRRDFHRHPELGFQEVRTSSIVASELQALGLEVSTGIAKTGVVALLEGDRPGPIILVRFDMDALPIQEETEVDYASQNPGVMHACGHDGHTAIGLTVARLLNNHREALAGTVKFIFQPAEEGLGGAEGMIKEGILENPKPDLALGLHLWNERPLGWLGIAPGPVMAAAEIFQIQITGKGGHGALPHTTQDPVLAASQVVTALQSIVSRNVSPLETGVISVTKIHGGDAFNVIPAIVEMAGTIRTYDPKIRELVLERFHVVVTGLVEAMGCQAMIQTQSITPTLVNDSGVTRSVQEIAKHLFPADDLDEGFRTMGSEDMAFIMQDIPGCYFFIGSANSDKGLVASHHHPQFNFDEGVLPRAAALMASATAYFLKS